MPDYEEKSREYTFRVGDDPRYRTTQEEQGYTFVHGYGFIPPPMVQQELRSIRHTANALGFSIILYYILSASITSYVTWMVVEVLMQGRVTENGQVVVSAATAQAINIISFVLLLLLPFLVYRALVHIPFRAAFPFRKVRLSIALPAVFIGLGASAVGVFFSRYFQNAVGFFGFIPIMKHIVYPVNLLPAILFCIYTVVLPAFFEELVFRGVILQSLRQFGDGFALVASSLVFMLLHANLVQGPNAFLMGLVIGYFVLITGSVWTGVMIHLANNLAAYLGDMLLLELPQELTGLVSNGVYLACIIAGLVGVAYLCRTREGMFVIHSKTNLMTTGPKLIFFFTSFVMLLAVALIFGVILSNFQMVIR